MFPTISPKQSFPALESEVLAYWKANGTFQKSIDSRPADNPYRFYDGPPFITGMPHYGHMLGSAVKDAVGRYWTMRGRRVERIWGWDCHGLPIEERVQKKLGLKSNADIEERGVKEFIDECYKYTSEVSSEWDWYIDKIGRWVDMDHAYRTMDQDYMESVMWVFSELWNKGLIYEGKRVSLYSWKLGTPISNFEVAMDDTYQTVDDPAITVKFELEPNDGFPEGTKVLAWTTTPWTIPANMALAVRNDIDYALVAYHDEQFILASSRLETVFKGKGEYTLIREFKGSELVGLGYIPPFPEYYYQKNGEKNHKIYHADFITDTDGTGIGHEAPEFGDVDFQLAKKEGIFISEAMDEAGKYTSQIFDYEGTHYLDLENPEKGANRINIERMKANGTLFKLEGITHRVPFCPRSGTPLMQKAQKSWFIDIQSQKEKLLKANEQINWFPEHLKFGRFAKGIESAPDWCISRTRYWGAPMPVWQNKDGSERVVVSSREEIFEMNKPYGQLTKVIFIRHGRTDYNGKMADVIGKAKLIEDGFIHIENLKRNLHNTEIDVIYSSPLQRCIDTIIPIADMKNISLKIDQDLIEAQLFSGQDKSSKIFDNQLHTEATPIEGDETLNELFERTEKFLKKVVSDNPGKTIVICSHFATIAALEKCLHNFDWDTEWKNFAPSNLTTKKDYSPMKVEYIFSDSCTPFNLHKPYIDSVKLQSPKTGEELTRIPEVLDVWMDSGSMPYAQVHFPFAGFEDTSIRKAETDEEKTVCFAFFEKMWKEEFQLDFKESKQGYEVVRERFFASNIYYIGNESDPESVIEMSHQIKSEEFIPAGASILGRIGTRKDMRGKGNGSKLIKKALSDLAKKGEKEVYVHAEVNNVEFYNGFGFIEIEDTTVQRGNTITVVMKKTLSKGDELQALVFPADFIAEYVGQVRAWFYVMHVLGVLLNPNNEPKPTPSFTNVITTGVINGNDGRKMSKSFGNYPDPRITIEKYGADPIRFYMLNSPLLSGGDMDFKEEQIIETVKGVMLPIWNTYSFFTTYANIDKWESGGTEVWFSRHGQSVSNTTGKMSDHTDDPELTEAGREQSKNAGKSLREQGKNFDIIVHTSRVRARDTAKIIGGELGYSGEYIVDDRFAEQSAGEYVGMTIEDIARTGGIDSTENHPNIRKIYKNNSTENIEQFEKRILEAYEDILTKYKGKRILIVAHAGTSRPILSQYFGMGTETAHYDTTIQNADPFRLMTTPLANDLDRWILSKLQVLIGQVHDAMDGYDVSRACRAIVDYMDHMTNWYVRLSRRRFWESGMTADKASAYETLHTVLVEVSKLLAPFMPFISEDIFRGLTGRESVHLEYITRPNRHLISSDLNRDMEICEHIVSLGLALRSQKNIRVRQPLQSVIITKPLSPYYKNIIKDELNVKEIRYENPENLALRIYKPDAKKIGPKFGKEVQNVIKLAKSGSAILSDDGSLTVGEKFNAILFANDIDTREWILESDEFTTEYIRIENRSDDGLEIEGGYGMVIALDTTLTDSLKLEGYARDIVRLIQDMRKEASYEVSDRISLSISGEGSVAILRVFSDYITRETLSTFVADIESPDLEKREEVEEGMTLVVSIQR